jgi:hypothetical protein
MQLSPNLGRGGYSVDQEIPVFCGIRSFVTVFKEPATETCHELDKFIPHHHLL